MANTRSSRPRGIGAAALIGSTLGALLVGAGAGWWIGASSAPLIAVETVECPPAPASPEPAAGATAGSDPELTRALEDSLLAGRELAARLDALEQRVEASGDDALSRAAAVDVMIGGLGDTELPILVEMLTGMDASALEGVDDVRGFTRRLAHVAMEGEFGDPAAGDAVAPGAGPLLFADDEELRNPHVIATRSFDAETDRIYVMIPTSGRSEAGLVVRWTRLDPPKVLRLGRIPVLSGSHWTSDVHASGGGWAPGRYQVTVYSADAALTPVGSGTFTVTPSDDS